VNRGGRFRLSRRFFRERNLVVVLPRGAGTECGAHHYSDKGALRITPVNCLMSVMPLFEFVLVMIGIGTFAILLTALVLTATARFHDRGLPR
jgi:hypothetical protein